MRRNQEISTGGVVILFLVLLNVVVLEQGFISHPQWYNLVYFTFPLLLVSVFFYLRKRV